MVFHLSLDGFQNSICHFSLYSQIKTFFFGIITVRVLSVIHGHSDQNCFLTNLQCNFSNYGITQSENCHQYHRYRTSFISFLLTQVISLKLEGTAHTNKVSQHLAFMCDAHIKQYVNAKNQGGYLRRKGRTRNKADLLQFLGNS